MPSVGETLQHERERQGRNAAEIAHELRITQRYVRAIEQGDLKSLPGSFFYKSFARQYAVILGIDPKTLASQLEQAVEIEELPLAGADPRFPVRTPDPIVEETNRRAFTRRRVGLSMTGLAAVLIGCSSFYTWWHRKQHPEPAPPAVATTPAPVSEAPSDPPVRVGLMAQQEP